MADQVSRRHLQFIGDLYRPGGRIVPNRCVESARPLDLRRRVQRRRQSRRDLNRDGDENDVFAVLWETDTNQVWVDINPKQVCR